MKPKTEPESASVALKLKHWCYQASSFQRQRDHVAFSVPTDAVPPEALVNAACNPKSKIPPEVKTDVALDQEEQLARHL